MTKLFVGGLAYAVNNQGLEDMFKPFGQVVSAQVVTDKFSGQSKGFGFVEMANDDEAQEAIKKLDGSSYEGRTIGVSVARPREERPQNSGFRSNSYGNNNDRRPFNSNRGRR